MPIWPAPSPDTVGAVWLHGQKMLTAAKSSVASIDDVSIRIAPDRRRHKRVKLTLLGRFMRASKNEYPCRLIDISVGGAAISSPVAVELGERIIVYFDHLGGLEGAVVRLLDGGFAMEFAATVRKRQKLAADLTWLVNQSDVDVASLRRPGHDRIALQNQSIPVRYEDGEIEDCNAIDVSISGASLYSAQRPPLGTEIQVGKLRARVVRHHDNGFGVAFIDIQRVEAIRRHFG